MSSASDLIESGKGYNVKLKPGSSAIRSASSGRISLKEPNSKIRRRIWPVSGAQRPKKSGVD
jgi:hypothetical protein